MTHSNVLRLCSVAAACFLLFVISPPAAAQYVFNPSNDDEKGIHYFGSAKDVRGDVVTGATIILSVDNATFIFLTDETGRFRGAVPIDTTPEKISAKCAKVGFQFVKLTKRPGPPSGTNKGPAVQVDCVFRADQK